MVVNQTKVDFTHYKVFVRINNVIYLIRTEVYFTQLTSFSQRNSNSGKVKCRSKYGQTRAVKSNGGILVAIILIRKQIYRFKSYLKGK